MTRRDLIWLSGKGIQQKDPVYVYKMRPFVISIDRECGNESATELNKNSTKSFFPTKKKKKKKEKKKIKITFMGFVWFFGPIFWMVIVFLC